MAEDLEKQIRDYLEAHNIATLAVSEGNTPGAHTVYYVSQGLRLYFESNPYSDKIRILKSNPRVSLTVDEDYRDWRAIKGIQLFGRAKLVEARKAPELEQEFHRKFPHLNDIGGIPENHVFVEITPEKIYFLDFTKELGHKSAFIPGNLGQSFLSKVNW